MARQTRTNWRRWIRRAHKHVSNCLDQEWRLWMWFAAGLAGILAQGFFDAVQAGQPYCLTWTKFLVSLVANLITFGTTYEQYKRVGARVPLLVQVSMAFVAGFTWQTVFEQLTAIA